MAAALRVTGAVATITLARPDARNAVGFDLAYTLADLARQARQRDDVWVVVVAAEGPDFCAGTAEDALAGITDDDSRLSDLRVAQMIADIEKPVICAAQGAVHEQGLEIALACDIRIADSTATFAMRQALSGSMPWDGGTQRLPRVIGRSRAVEMLLTGRELDAETALSIGLVNEVVPPSAVGRRAADIAAAIAAHGPHRSPIPQRSRADRLRRNTLAGLASRSRPQLPPPVHFRQERRHIIFPSAPLPNLRKPLTR